MGERGLGCPSCAVFDKLPPCPNTCMSDKCKEKIKPVINVHHKPVIWILGGPGSGKGTQCMLLRQKYDFTHLSTGDLLRAEVVCGSDRAKHIQKLMARGDLVPNDIVLNLLREEMKRLEPTAKGYLIDGYPREKHQGKAFEKSVSPVTVIIYFETSPETMLKRLHHRAANSDSLRPDDNEDTYKLRIDTFLENNKTILDQYMHKLHRINAERSTEEIYAEAQKYIDPIMDKANLAFAAHSAAITKAALVKEAALAKQAALAMNIPVFPAKPALQLKSVLKPTPPTDPPPEPSDKSETDK